MQESTMGNSPKRLLNMSSDKYDAFIQKMAAEMKARIAHEKKETLTDPEEIESLYFECGVRGKPYYCSDGQFTGGLWTERFDHPFSPERKIQFDFDEEGTRNNAVTWIPYKDYPYPM